MLFSISQQISPRLTKQMKFQLNSQSLHTRQFYPKFPHTGWSVKWRLQLLFIGAIQYLILLITLN